MKVLTVEARRSAGRILCSTIFRSGGRKLLARGHVISEEDIRLLETEGMQEVAVSELEEGEVGEDAAAQTVAHAMACGALELQPAAAGRANLVAMEPCCVLVDDDLLKQINCLQGIGISTAVNFAYAAAGQRVATVKSAPFVVAQSQLDAVLSTLKQKGPILQARPIRRPVIAVLYTDAVAGDRARKMFECVMQQRLERFGLEAAFVRSSVESDPELPRALQSLLGSRPTAILVASSTSPAGPEDAIGRAMMLVGCELERFMAPVEPGNLLLLGYKDGIPVISSPGCWRSVKPNVVDLILPPILAKYRVSGWEIACLGHGGLLG
jgi:molybdenum cofactor cytidylyltransferase